MWYEVRAHFLASEDVHQIIKRLNAEIQTHQNKPILITSWDHVLRVFRVYPAFSSSRGGLSESRQNWQEVMASPVPIPYRMTLCQNLNIQPVVTLIKKKKWQIINLG